MAQHRARHRSSHLFGPQQALGGVSLTGGFLGALAGMIRTDPRASYAITENSLPGWTAHPVITAALASAGNATRTRPKFARPKRITG